MIFEKQELLTLKLEHMFPPLVESTIADLFGRLILESQPSIPCVFFQQIHQERRVSRLW